jgi:precorrin-6B methylase 2
MTYGARWRTALSAENSNADCSTQTRLISLEALDILASENEELDSNMSKSPSHKQIRQSDGKKSIQLSDISAGWGDGTHPTTRLCLDFIRNNMQAGQRFLDYGTGSGVLSIYAAKLGASSCLAVDVCDDSIQAATRNIEDNGVADLVEVTHTRYIYVGEDRFRPADVTVANILPGPLIRLVDILWTLTNPGGWICLSGMRPHQLEYIQSIYAPFVDRETEVTSYGSHDQWGKRNFTCANTLKMTQSLVLFLYLSLHGQILHHEFSYCNNIYVGEWACWAARTRVMTAEEMQEARRILQETTFG